MLPFSLVEELLPRGEKHRGVPAPQASLDRVLSGSTLLLSLTHINPPARALGMPHYECGENPNPTLLCSHVSPLAAHAGVSGQGGAQSLPGSHPWGAVDVGGSPAAPSIPHSCWQELLSSGGKSRPSMARRCTMCFWITSRHSVCREGTAREQRCT